MRPAYPALLVAHSKEVRLLRDGLLVVPCDGLHLGRAIRVYQGCGGALLAGIAGLPADGYDHKSGQAFMTSGGSPGFGTSKERGLNTTHVGPM
jgi:hypothetical protein